VDENVLRPMETVHETFSAFLAAIMVAVASFILVTVFGLRA
jgi:hypothetical protein